MRRTVAVVALLALLAPACGSGDVASTTLRIYTSVTQDTVDAVVEAFGNVDPAAEVEVFRAPTGEVAARIAAEQREGGLQADILWLTDPLSIQQYSRDGVLLEFTPRNAEFVPAEWRTETFVGTRVLNLVIVASTGMTTLPADWRDLADVEDGVAIPDPGFAGSAFGAVGFFALDPAYGFDFYRDLHDAGATEVRSPGDVVAGVAEGQFDAGITLDRTARAAADDGSPVVLIWPASGAIALYSPIAVVDRGDTTLAESFVDFVLSVEAQQAIAATGWEPIRDDVAWDRGGLQQSIDWSAAFDRQDELLSTYRQIFEE